jgi:hypothetical protein
MLVRTAVFDRNAADDFQKTLVTCCWLLTYGSAEQAVGQKIAESEDVVLRSCSFEPEKSYRFQAPTADPERI